MFFGEPEDVPIDLHRSGRKNSPKSQREHRFPGDRQPRNNRTGQAQDQIADQKGWLRLTKKMPKNMVGGIGAPDQVDSQKPKLRQPLSPGRFGVSLNPMQG